MQMFVLFVVYCDSVHVGGCNVLFACGIVVNQSFHFDLPCAVLEEKNGIITRYNATWLAGSILLFV
jgi:hypothetical protein